MSLFATGFRGADRQTFAYLGKGNSGWGVCGFTSVVYALYTKRPGDRAMLINATRHYTVLASIKNFLSELRAGGEVELLREIEEFNKTFHGEDFTIESYVNLINESDITADFSKDNRYGLAMTPKGVARYLEYWGFEAKIRKVKTFSPDLGGNAIIGVKKPLSMNPNLTRYDRLCHWMYRHNGKIYSWGREFASVKAANRDYSVNWVIEIRTPRAPRVVEPSTL